MATTAPTQPAAPDYQGYYLQYPRSPAVLRFFRAPLLFWRLGIDSWVNRWLMVISTWGRKSRLPRHAVVDYHIIDGKKYIISGYGPDANWYKNLLADPHVTLQTKAGTEHAIARRITDPDEIIKVIEGFEREYKTLVEGYRQMGYEKFTVEAALAEPDKVYIIGFEPTTEPTPAPVEADLKWMLPILRALLVAFLVSMVARTFAKRLSQLGAAGKR